MKGRLQKLFLPIFVGILVFFAGLVLSPNTINATEEVQQNGSITVCKIIIDSDGNIVDGSTKSGVLFIIPGITPAQTTGGAPAGQISDSLFTTPLAFNSGVIGSNDAECVTYGNLGLGNYYYGQETINPSAGWEAPKYNDQFSTSINSINDFFSYDGNLFDGNSGNDDARNKNSDGHIVLNEGRPDRTLVVLNNMEAVSTGGRTPTSGGSPSGGGVSTPTCSSSNVQKVDQVWFSNITSTQATVHWANLGDAHSYHIAYGPSQNNLPWGVQVPGNINNYTLFNLQGGNLWVRITANASADCGGPTSETFQAGERVGKVLGASTLADTGANNNLLIFLAGLGSIVAGLWVFSISLKKSIKS